MFLVVPSRHRHGVSIQISINLGKKLLRLSCIRKIADLNLGESLCKVTFFLFSDSGLSLFKIVDFYFDLFWMAWHWKPAISREHYLYRSMILWSMILWYSYPTEKAWFLFFICLSVLFNRYICLRRKVSKSIFKNQIYLLKAPQPADASSLTIEWGLIQISPFAPVQPLQTLQSEQIIVGSRGGIQ